MKKSIVVIGLFAASFSAFAAEDSPIIAQVTHINDKIESVSLSQTGEMTITKLPSGRKIVRQLSNDTAAGLAYEVEALRHAEITTTHHRVVCMMMVNPMFMPSLSVSSAETEMKLVLTTSNCATPTSTSPTEREDYATAVSLKNLLIVLATEAVTKSR